MTKPNISFVANVVSQFLNSICDSPWNAVVRNLEVYQDSTIISEKSWFTQMANGDIVAYTDADWIRSPSNRRSTFVYSVLIGGISSYENAKSRILSNGS